MAAEGNGGGSSAGIISRIAGMSAFDLALRLTLLDLLLRPVGDSSVRPLTLAFAALGLLIPGQFRSRLVWVPITMLTGVRVALDWPLPDNHAFLLFYWCLAVSMSLYSRDPGRCLALNGKMLIGLAFAFAVVWKVFLSGDYMDGRFFRIAMLTDHRFEWLTRLAAGLSEVDYGDMRQFVVQHIDGMMPFSGSEVPPQSARFLMVSRAITYWTVFIEGAIALLFLMPKNPGLSSLRDPLLVIFCITTYSVATVDGFGWLLIAMGVSQGGQGNNKIKIAYILAFLLIIIYSYMAKVYR